MMQVIRPDGRAVDALRSVDIELGFQPNATASALIRWGGTHVLCAVNIEDKVPQHRLASGAGWLTAEYSMLPGAGDRRVTRERHGVGGRTAEIQRLIGRSLRAAVDLGALGPRTLWIDCDVISADGGTRCAAITGATVALAVALNGIGKKLQHPVAAVSVGVRQGHVIADLSFAEDTTCDVDLNFVTTPTGLVEIQGTAEGRPFSRDHLLRMIDLGTRACDTLFGVQRAALKAVGITL